MHCKLRHIAVPILLAFVLGITAVKAHAATHLPGEAIDCNLCSTYSDPPTNAVGGVVEASPSIQVSFDCEHPPEWTENGATRRLFARGPPLSN
jgi:hypothetical protein